MNFLRVILNPPTYCNYNCILCHREGVSPEKITQHTMSDISNSMLVEIYERAKSYGYNGVLYTGGEPLLEPNIIDLVKLFKSELTLITTNGSLLNDNLIYELKSASLDQLNISMCSVNEDVYTKITRQTQCDVVSLKKVIYSIVAAGIRVQINNVLYKGINDDDDSIRSILDFAIKARAKRIVFIQVTVPSWINESRDRWCPTYKYVKQSISLVCSYTGRAERGDKFVYKGGLEVVLTECSDRLKRFDNGVNVDLCVDMSGYILPMVFSKIRVPVMPDKASLAVDYAISSLPNVG